MTVARRIYVTELAAVWRCHRTTAYRRLVHLDRRAGGRVIARDGRGGRIYTTPARLRRADADWLEESLLVREEVQGVRLIVRTLEDRVSALRDRLKRVERGLGAEAKVCKPLHRVAPGAPSL